MSSRNKIIAGVTAVLLVVMTAFGVARLAVAQEDGDAPPAQGRDEFIDRLAQKLGVDPAQLEQAIRETNLEIVDEKLARGEITAEQAEKARERIESGKGPAFGKFKDRGQRDNGPPGHAFGQVRRGLEEQAAGALGMSEDELKAELRAGKSIADVAAERGVSLDSVKAAVVADATARMDAAVNDGRLDRTQADAQLQRLNDRLNQALNKKKTPDPAPTP